MSLLQQIHSGQRYTPPRVLVYGTEGIGKSTFAANAPKPIFIPTEDGLDQIECDSFPLAENLSAVTDALAALINEKHDYQSVVIDSLDWLERLKRPANSRCSMHAVRITSHRKLPRWH